ncbi:MAG: protein-disulfide reductase DsbD domain-containing protein, partial [Pseudomonadota bacterium]
MNKTALSLAALVASAVQAHALEDVVDVDFLHGWRESDGHHYAGVTITLAEGWKTYWRAPQGAGIPPVFTVLEHSNLDTMEMEFPKPMMLEDFGEKVLG